jgi:uncharacterized protein (TIGR03382 family)
VDSICQFAEDCASGLCIKLPGASRSTCQLGCSLAADGCPDGQVCGGIGDPDDGVCLPEAKPVGAPCEEGAECTTRLCIGQSGATVCVQACTAEGAAGCPCATTCVTLTDGGSACLPNAGAEPCAAAGAGCASNLDCSTGRCEAGACSGASGGSGADAGLGSSGDATGDAAGGVGGPGVGGHADLSGDQVDAGTASGGCSAGPGPAGGGALLLFLAAALLSRRRHA